MKIRFVIFLLVGLLTTSFNAPSDNLSLLMVKLKYNSPGMSGFGGSLKIRNVATEEVFEGHSTGFSPFIIIENLPNGLHNVEELKIAAGSNVLAMRNVSDFNPLKIDSPKVYYLGSYITTKIPPMMDLAELNLQVIRSDNDEEEVINRQLQKKSDDWLRLKIDFEKILFLKDSTTINLSFTPRHRQTEKP